jgi:hypothetical protein
MRVSDFVCPSSALSLAALLSLGLGVSTGCAPALEPVPVAHPAYANFHGSKACISRLNFTITSKDARYTQLYKTMCTRKVPEVSTGRDEAFDVAVNVIGCVASGHCLDGEDSEPPRRLARSSLWAGELSEFRRDVAAEWYVRAQEIDWAKLRVELDSFDAEETNRVNAKEHFARWKPLEPSDADQLRDAFVARAKASVRELASVIKRFDAQERVVYLEPAMEAARRWYEDEQADAKLIEKALELKGDVDAALVDDKPPAPVMASVTKLRDRAVRACQGRGRTFAYCLGGPLVFSLTKQLVLLADKSKDAARAEAERRLIEYAPLRTTLHESTVASLSAAIAKEELRRQAYARAKESGVSEAALTEKFGSAPRGRLDRPDPPIYPVIGVRSRDYVESRRAVARVEVNGERATIHFAVKHSTYLVGVGCHRTNRILSISSTGYVTYEEECSGTRPATSTDALPPVEVPASEAALVQPGDFVVTLSDPTKHRGCIVAVYTDEKAKPGTEIAYRGFKLTPVAPQPGSTVATTKP